MVITFQENRCNVPLVTKTESNSKLCFRSGTRGEGGGGGGLYTVSGNFTRAAVDIFMQMRLPFFFPLPPDSRCEQCWSNSFSAESRVEIALINGAKKSRFQIQWRDGGWEGARRRF